MRGSLKIAAVSGIQIGVHWTFLILVAWIILVSLSSGETLIGAFHAVALVTAVFGCIVLHELGHALAAKRFNIRTRDITLLPIGGIARLERIPRNPTHEFWIAVAGPAVNVAIAALLYGYLRITHGSLRSFSFDILQGPFLYNLMVINIGLVAFNLLPAFPMDGGRVLRSILAHKLDPLKATSIAATLGKGMAIIFGLVGLLGNPFLVFIALFVYLGAQQELHMEEMHSYLQGVLVRDGMITDFESLSPDEPVTHAIEKLLAGAQHDFPVLDAGRLVGMLTRNDLVKALSKGQKNALVGQIMQDSAPPIDDEEPIEDAILRMRSDRTTAIPVSHDSRIVGMLTPENLHELVMIRAAERTAAQNEYKDF